MAQQEFTEWASGLTMEDAISLWRQLNSKEFKMLIYIYSYFHNPDAILRQLAGLDFKDRKNKLRELAAKELEEYASDSP